MTRARGRAEWGQTVAVVQWVYLAFTGKVPEPHQIAPEWVAPKPPQTPAVVVPPELEAVVWDAWVESFRQNRKSR